MEEDREDIKYEYFFNTDTELSIYLYTIYKSERKKKKYDSLKYKYETYDHWKYQYVWTRYEHVTSKSLADLKRMLNRKMNKCGLFDEMTYGIFMPMLATVLVFIISIKFDSITTQNFMAITMAAIMYYYGLKMMVESKYNRYKNTFYNDYIEIIEEMIEKKSNQ